MKRKTLIQADVADDKSRFCWKRPAPGCSYSWIEYQDIFSRSRSDPSDIERFLKPSLDCRFVQYFPLEDEKESGLFRKFAFLEPTPDAFLEFANQHGSLGTPRLRKREGIDGEEFNHWWCANYILRDLVTTWEMIQKKDEKALAKRIVDRHVKSCSYLLTRISPKFNWAKHMKLNSFGSRQPRDNIILHEVAYVQGTMHDQMASNGASRPRMVWSPADFTLKLRYLPRTLLGALYLQFALSLNGKWEFRECAVCKKPFKLAPGINRANRITCSEVCKTYQYRRRIDKALELHGQGKTIREIVKELNVGQPRWNLKKKMETVKSWIAKGQQ